MQPQLRQTPPRYARSTIAVLNPSCAARMAVTYPPGPEPMMMMSKAVSAIVTHALFLEPTGGGRSDRRAVTIPFRDPAPPPDPEPTYPAAAAPPAKTRRSGCPR